jgi:hypothetical protein
MLARSETIALRRATSHRIPVLPAGWPLYALFLGFPLWWVLGLSAFIWPIMAVPMAAALLRRHTVAAPRGFGLWIAFVLLMLGSATQLNGADKYIHFGYRAALYLSATVILLYVFNMSRDGLPTRRVITIMAIFWMFVVVGGFLGVLFPSVSFTSPVERLLPGRFASSEFIHELVHPAFAQVMDILGYEAPRPKAPFTYATNWGAAFGLLTPFVILAWKYARTQAWKTVTALMFVAAIVPVVSSLNRALWLSLGVGLLYAAVRLALAGRGRALRSVILLLVTIVAVVYVTPLRTLVEDRFANPHSNERRANLYEESIDVVMRSPLLGFGAPQPSTVNPNAPPVGTQGQLWQVLVSHGIPATILFLWWFAFRFWRMRAASTELGFWCHVLVLIALVQAPFYDWLGAPLVVIMVAIALAARESGANGAAATADAESNALPPPP